MKLNKEEKEKISKQAREIVERMSAVEIKNPYSKNPLDDFDDEGDDDECDF